MYLYTDDTYIPKLLQKIKAGKEIVSPRYVYNIWN